MRKSSATTSQPRDAIHIQNNYNSMQSKNNNYNSPQNNCAFILQRCNFISITFCEIMCDFGQHLPSERQRVAKLSDFISV